MYIYGGTPKCGPSGLQPHPLTLQQKPHFGPILLPKVDFKGWVFGTTPVTVICLPCFPRINWMLLFMTYTAPPQTCQKVHFFNIPETALLSYITQVTTHH